VTEALGPRYIARRRFAAAPQDFGVPPGCDQRHGNGDELDELAVKSWVNIIEYLYGY